MFDNLLAGLIPGYKDIISKDEIANLLKTDKDALAAFENAYSTKALDIPDENLAKQNSKQIVNDIHANNKVIMLSQNQEEIINRIVNDFLEEAPKYVYTRPKNGHHHRMVTVKPTMLPDKSHCVTLDELKTFPQEIRPQSTSLFQHRDIKYMAYPMVLLALKESMNKQNPEQVRKFNYDHFRQGLDILDIDPIIYEIIGMNQNSMGYWLPKITETVDDEGFFKIPDTTIVKIPMNILQLTRMEYTDINPTTRKIVNNFCYQAFNLDKNGDYFVKTGTYSSKFDFRNCRVTTEKEISELGEYLLFNHTNACNMAGSLHIGPDGRPLSIYGMSTTNEWVVREYISDKENNPCIYKGLPLHTEYRAFVDFDTDEVLSIVPYWDPDTMEKHFNQGSTISPHDYHDYTIYVMHEDTLMKRYNDNKDSVVQHLENIVSNINLPGQWSVDIMQNGDDFWIIDMATAQTSAFRDSIPIAKRKPIEENWLPDLSKK